MGPEITISVAGFIQVRREAPKSWKKCMASDSEANELRADVSYVKNTEDMEIVEKEDLIESYKYGSQIIPVNGKSLLLLKTYFSKKPAKKSLVSLAGKLNLNWPYSPALTTASTAKIQILFSCQGI